MGAITLNYTSLPTSLEPWSAAQVNSNNNKTTPSNTSSGSNSNTGNINMDIDNNTDNQNNTDSSPVMTLSEPTKTFSVTSPMSSNASQSGYEEEKASISTKHAGIADDGTALFDAALRSPVSSFPVTATSPALTTTRTMAPTLAAVTPQAEPSRASVVNNPTIALRNKEKEEHGTEERNRDNGVTSISTTTTTTTVDSKAPDWQRSMQDDGLVIFKECVSIERDSRGTDHKDSVWNRTQQMLSSSAHITHSAAVIDDRENLVAQLEIVPPKLDPPTKELSSRKSLSLPPLQTSPIISMSIPIPTTTAIQAATMDLENPYYSTSIAPVSAATSPTSTVLNSASGFNLQSSQSAPSSEQGSYLMFESPYPSPTPAASPTDYFSTSWILPPIPSFSEMGLTFDKSRSSSSNSIVKCGASSHNHGHRGNEGPSRSCQQSHISHTTDKPHRSGMDLQCVGPRTSERQEIVPDYNPSVFDQIQSDENEAYILWSTTPESGSGGATVSASVIDTSPAVNLPRNRHGAILSPSTSQQTAQSIPTPEPSSTPLTVKRWSAGENSKVKNQGRDSFDSSDRVRVQTPTATTPSQETILSQSSSSVAHGASDAFLSQPSSPSFVKPPEKISGSVAMVKPAFSGSSTYSKANNRGTSASGPPLSSASNKSAANQESRVIMAATVEKLVEKLTSDIDYTFLTDFFLIYRLFITPPALLQLLMARFHWALTEDTPQRMIVRVRTFVVLRHWLLNYFEYDFMGYRLLRRTLIQNLRQLNTHPIICSSVRDQRIVQELRRLFQLKRKQYSHAAAQLTLEGSAIRRGSSSRSVQQAGTDNIEYSGVERSSFEEQSGGESSDQESELYSTDSQSDEDDIQADNSNGGNAENDDDQQDDMYEEVSSYIIDEDHIQRDLAHFDNEKDDSDIDSEELNRDQRTFSVSSASKTRLPSPTLFSGPSQPNDVTMEPTTSSHHHYHHISPNGNGGNPSADLVDVNAKSHPRPRASGSFEISPHHHHHRSHTVPHFHEARPPSRPRPLSYIAPSIDTSSSAAFSPPESPLPLEVYSASRPLYQTGPSSNDKKKTWSQYMAATVGQLSKVKRVFKPKSSQSIQDLRSPAISPQQQHFTFRNGPTEREMAKFGSIKEAAVSSRYWNDRRILSDHKVYQSATMHDAMTTTTNSFISSSEGYHGARDDHDNYDYDGTDRGAQWSSDEDEDLRSETTGKSARNHRMDHNSAFRYYPSAQDRNHGRGSRIAAAATPTGGPADYGYSVMDDGEQRLSTPVSRGSDVMSEEQDLILDHRASGHGPIPVEWDQLPNSSNMKSLRRTTPKRDNRASWMTFSSTNSSVFGAVLSQGHMPPSQAIRERGDSQNLERFVERTYGAIAQPVGPAGGRRPSYQGVTRPKSTEDINGRHIQQGITKVMMRDDSGAMSAEAAIIPPTSGGPVGGSTVQAASPEMNSGRRSHTVAQHPHRQTVPIMHHHYHHHHYLQEYPPQRRHSTDVQTLRGWSTSTTTTTTSSSLGDKRNSAELSRGTSQNSISLLEGAAYVAALQETQRQLKQMISQDGGHRSAPSPPPVTIPPHSQTYRGYSPQSPDFAVKNVNRLSRGSIEQGRPYTNPSWRHLSDPDVNPPPGLKSPSKSAGAGGVTVAQQRGVHRIHTPWYHPPHGTQQTRAQYENSYSQQRSPMNPRFQSIMSSSASTVREYARPTSLVLRYRSETIAQQLCLIEREQLNEIQWFELVNAGWKKKSPGANTGTAAPAPSLNEEQNDEDVTEGGNGDVEGSEAGGNTCNWVTSQILKTTDLDTRVKVVEKLIRIAQTCYNYHNFSSLTQIMLGLQAHEVSRLSRTWARVRSQETKMMEDLVEFTSPFYNWRHLRNAMKTMADEWGGAATGQDPVPVVPVSVAVGVSSGSAPGSGSSKRQSKEGGGLFSKIALSSKDKDKQQYHQSQSSFSHHGKSSTLTGGQSSSPTKSFSGPVFPSLVSTLSSSNKDKDKDKDMNKTGSPGLQPIGGCIPFLGR
ncbi:Guanine nucleotide exchange factor lte1 [Linnemannia zychae]|nr:Guanine nucleotide exchange factor lte1 [Linnemannia zychae]